MTVSKKNWGDFPARVASAIVLLAIVGYALYVGGSTFVALVALFVAAGCYESGEMLIPKVEPAVRKVLHLAVILPMAAGVLVHDYRMTFISVAIAIAIRPVYALLIAFVGFGGWALISVRGMHDGMLLTCLAIVAVICSDTGAYFVGRIVGGPKLWLKVSPGKTRSGAIGALVVTAMFTEGVHYNLTGEWSYQAAVIGIAISIVAQSGDMAESALKRWNNVKDSGKLIPGHGGVLDRVDGLLPVVVFLYIIEKLDPSVLLGLLK